MSVENQALWVPRHGKHFQVGPAPYTPPGPHEVVVRTRAVGLNLVDGIPRLAYRVILPWLTFPAIVGNDVAGEIVETGMEVALLQVGDRVLGHALGIERSRNRGPEGAFQRYVVLMDHMVSRIPDPMPYTDAAGLPLQLSTAATGLFQADHLGLDLPTAHRHVRTGTVLVWGGSTGVGSNAIQLAHAAGYRVIASSSPHNFNYLRSLGATDAIDRTSPHAVRDAIMAVGLDTLAGSIAIGNGSLTPVTRIVTATAGSRRIASASPALATRLQTFRARRQGVHVSTIWGGTLKDNSIGRAIYTDFLPAALAEGRYRTAPPTQIVGHGLAALPAALALLHDGVSAKKLVVAL